MIVRSGESGFYRLSRAALRLAFGLFFRRIRILQAEPLSGPALLVMNHPPTLADALVVIAAFDRPIHCLLDRDELRGWLARWCARAVGIIPCGFQDEDWTPALETCCSILNRGGLVLVFARQRAAGPEGGFAPEACEIALEMDARMLRDIRLPVRPVHLFLPAPPSRLEEVLIHVDASLATLDGKWVREGDVQQWLGKLDRELEQACRRNPFRLHPEDADRFIDGLEAVMREDFAETWSKRENWKQKVEDFELSPFLVRLANQLNYSHPGRLVALNEALQDYTERKRQNALQTFQVEAQAAWIKSWARRAAAWLETVVGFPVACYGLVNLVPAWFVMWIAGLLRKGLWRATPGQWAARALIALACYAGEITIAARMLPRAEAGYYAPSLIFSGTYLLRYLWLLEHRSLLLAHAAGAARTQARLRRARKALVTELKRDQDRYAALWKIAH
ncbi:MAG: lysophospholipid acyltransferase family protein [Terriglobia bacterium]